MIHIPSHCLSIQFIVNVSAGAPNQALNEKGFDGYDVPKAKSVSTGQGEQIPYVSAQSLKRRMRDLIMASEPIYAEDPNIRYRIGKADWKKVEPGELVEEKVSQIGTAGDPISFVDDDLFGYMIAGKGGDDDKSTRTRPAPLSMTPAIALQATRIKNEFNTLRRPGLHPMPFRQEIYRSALNAASLLHLTSVGTFFTEGAVHQNIRRPDNISEAGLEDAGMVLGQPALRLPLDERKRRAALAVEAFAYMGLGANSTLKMTSYRPPVILIAGHAGSDPLFQYVLQSGGQDPMRIDFGALKGTLESHQDLLRTPVWIGWDSGYSPQMREQFVTQLETQKQLPFDIRFGEARQICLQVADYIKTQDTDHLFV
jgi:CRISPR-associated protein Cst2